MNDIDKRLEELEDNYNECDFDFNDIGWLISTLKVAREEKERLEKENEIYFQAIGEIEYAMGKVGWNNSRIEYAFDEMNKNLKALGGDHE